MPQFDYDVFISYSRRDRPWAERLSQSLQAQGLKAFYDRESIRSGDPWERDLIKATDASRHLVVLWSSYAKESDWVNRERGRFDARINQSGQILPLTNQRMIFLLLEGQSPAFAGYQAVTELLDAGAYEAGIDQLDGNLWQRVVGKIEEAIRSGDDARSIPLAILATTRSGLEEIKSSLPPASGFGPSLDILLERMGIEKKALKDYYGEKRTDWRPFGSQEDIWTILDRLRGEISQALQGENITWALVGEGFWSRNKEDALREANKLAADVSVIVIDPLSLYDPDVQRGLNLVLRSFGNEKAVFMILPPFRKPDVYNHLKESFENLAIQVADYFYEPWKLTGDVSARCEAQIGDLYDIKRWLITALRQFVWPANRRTTSKFTSMGNTPA
jgi:hypothetical protein